ncbi:uncharacterized protein [Rutidosis leptorrhynchoides]|uniref:uncharacterized protein isoform X3 n=1 Tax=Rutidosis leptorrhynchoides TaxID=125765 RepID=UPI003A99ADD1
MITILFLIGSDSSIWLRGEPTLKGNGSCYIQEERPCKSIGIGCSSTPDETLISMDAHQEHEKLTGNNSKNTQYDISNWEYQKQATNASKDNVAQHQSNMSASTSTSGTGTKSRKRYSKEKAKDADRRRRIRIAAAIDSLESSLPLSHGGNKTDIVDKCVDYIKSLQHHLKELSQNRLGGEPTSNHMMHLEVANRTHLLSNGLIWVFLFIIG